MFARHRILAVSLSLAFAASASVAAAQPNDVRLIRPDVMLLLDTSGSMEWMPGQDGVAPICNPGSPALRNDRNRWAIAAEVLTGSYENYTCEAQPRTDASRLDYNYYIPHHRMQFSAQVSDGILDQYSERVKFGFMSFDSYSGQPDFSEGHHQDRDGMWSYGRDSRLICPDCDANYLWNAGARGPNASTSEGGLVSCGPGTDDSGVLSGLNAQIQSSILQIKPYWATPLASMLDDADYYFDNHPDVNAPPGPTGNDPYHNCRDHFVILVSDGAPNVDGRPFCERTGCQCPWLPVEEEALELFDPLAPDHEKRHVLVIGYDVLDLPTRRSLWGIAEGGGTALACDDADLCPGGDPVNCGSPITCETDAAHPGAFFAGCRDVDAATCADRLRTALSELLDWIAPNSTTRTRPTFTNSVGAGANGQFQFNSAFTVSSGSPWTGTLQRNRYECSGADPVAVEFDESGAVGSDDFAEILNQRNIISNPRQLKTFLPTGSPGPAVVQATVTNTGGSAMQDFRRANTAVTTTVLSVSGATERNALLDWMHGEVGTPREEHRLGAIYHSNPAVLGPPDLNLADGSFRDFLDIANSVNGPSGATSVLQRPTVLYVGSGDGIMHAFDAVTGEELWGFVTPYLLPRLKNIMSGSQSEAGVDGGILARDVLLGVEGTPLATDWRTVLLFGLRGGGDAYAALDVTDPYNPKFLWQFAPTNLGKTYGTPGIGTVLIEDGGQLKEKAVAVIPGGLGVRANQDPLGCPRGGAANPDLRANVRCWTPEGRGLWILDLETGAVLKAFDDADFDAPVVGTPALFQSQHGTALRRTYVTDTEGTLYMVDTGFTDATDWTVTRVYDLYSGGVPDDSVPSYEEPLLTVNENLEVVVAYGSGEPDNLAGAGEGRIVSLTEKLKLDDEGLLEGIEMERNWQITLEDLNEKLTGPMQLFDGALFFTSFIPSTSVNDLCAFGRARVWGVDILLRDDDTDMPLPRWDEDGLAATQDLVHSSNLADNTVLFGVGITRRPSCAVEEEITDDFGRARSRLADSTPGEYRLVVQSGPNAPGPGWQAGAGPGGGPNVFERALQAPERPINILSWVNVIEEQ